MAALSDLGSEVRDVTVRANGVVGLADLYDAEIIKRFPGLAYLARGRADSALGETVVSMIREAADSLSQEWQQIAPAYLGLPGTTRGPHKNRQVRAAADLGIRRRDRPYTPSNFRQNAAPVLFNELARELQRLHESHAPRRRSQRSRLSVADWPVKALPREGQEILLLAATPSMRDGPRSALVQFVRELEPYIRSAGHMVYAIDGSYAALWRAGLLHNYSSLERLPAGVDGGLVHATEVVLSAPKSRNPVAAVYLIDPRDPSARFPVASALKRACVTEEVPLLTSLASALRWFRLQWAVHVLDGSQSTPDPVETRLLLSGREAHVLGLGRQAKSRGIALAAHDRHKHALLEFAGDRREFLTNGFDKRWATHVTGRLLNGEPISAARMPDFGLYDMDDKQRDLEIKKISAWQKEQAKLSRQLDHDWFTLVTHGRQGGLIQLARRVIDGDVTTCVFFQDPTTPRESDTELQVLDRATQLPNVDCLTLHDEKSASTWANARTRITERNVRVSSATLIEAFKKTFNVDLVLAYDLHTKDGAVTSWDNVVKCAATYFLEAVISAVRRRDRLQPATVGLSWGGAIRNVIDQLGAAPPRPGASGRPGALGVREYVEVTMRKGGDQLQKQNPWRVTNLATAIGGVISAHDLTVVPMLGIMGTARREIESHALAASVANVLGGSTLSHPEYAFKRQSSTEPSEDSPARIDLENAWGRLDIALCSCDAVRDDLLSTVVGFPADMLRALKQGGAIGEFGHIYLSRDDTEAARSEWGGYESTGIPPTVLQDRVRNGADIILVAGAEPERELPAWAALRARVVSTFITDTRFAWNVLCHQFGQKLTRQR